MAPHSSDERPSTHESHAQTPTPAGGLPVTRRQFVGGATTAVAAGLAGCLGGGGTDDAPAPVTIPDGATCDVCGMAITQQPGPTAEIFYANARPSDHENPARFDSVWEAFQFDFRHDWTRTAFYVTDYSAVDYDVRTDGDQQLLSTHYERAAFVDATAATYVVGSAVVGAMGKDLVGFAERADAERFRDEYGGDLATFDDVTPDLVSSLGA
ncbi:NosL family protein (plasmid) [Halobacterium hubeiense]|uniref:NosL family protein n=1 Tax=Halobacterium hubeiense TaxID=1407499 RepID=A0A0U5D1I7_9EURY|nr:nitrous oxide reductase accessory protein NosL [Halobacterium hubeiense]CQH63322.1 NosL family protein [Halobacterium hubeiense]